MKVQQAVEFQKRINAITQERNAALERIEHAKKALTHLADTIAHRSTGNIQAHIVGVVEEVL